MWRNDAPVFIDYQDGCRGPLSYDLASLLYSPSSGLQATDRPALIGRVPARARGLRRDTLEAGATRGALSAGAGAADAGFGCLRAAGKASTRASLEWIEPTRHTLAVLRSQGYFDMGLPHLEAWLGRVFEG